MRSAALGKQRIMSASNFRCLSPVFRNHMTTPVTNTRSPAILIFAKSALMAAMLPMPIPARFRVMQVARYLVAGVKRDADDIDRVVVYRIRR